MDTRGRPDAPEEVRAHEAGEGAQPRRALQTVAGVIRKWDFFSSCIYLWLYVVIGRTHEFVYLVVAQRTSVTPTQIMFWYFLAQEMESPIIDITDEPMLGEIEKRTL